METALKVAIFTRVAAFLDGPTTDLDVVGANLDANHPRMNRLTVLSAETRIIHDTGLDGPRSGTQAVPSLRTSGRSMLSARTVYDSTECRLLCSKPRSRLLDKCVSRLKITEIWSKALKSDREMRTSVKNGTVSSCTFFAEFLRYLNVDGSYACSSFGLPHCG